MKRTDARPRPSPMPVVLTKSQEKRIQGLIRQVHEKRLADSLAVVEQTLLSWREGGVPIMKVDDVIREHSQRSARFFSRYANTAARDLEAMGVLDEARAFGFIEEEEYRQLTKT
jgi:hypothetical protein